MADFGHCSMSLDVRGVIAYARAHGHKVLLLSTFPDLNEEEAQLILDGEMTVNRTGNRLTFMRENQHAH